MPVEFTREKLHALVWKTPMVRLAGELQISDVGLRKICHRHDIPTPPAGWWAKKKHGKAPEPKPLPASRPSNEIVTVYSSGGLPHDVKAARDLVRALPGAPNDVFNPGPVFLRTEARLAKVKPGRDGIKRLQGAGLISMAVLPSSETRALDLLRSLIATAQSTGIELIRTDEGAAFSYEAETVSFELVEAVDQVEHVPTEQELAAVAKWEREREERHRRSGYWSDYGKPWIPKRDNQHNGRLAVRLEPIRVQTEESYWGKSILGTFTDTRKRDVMKSVPRIVETIAAIAVAKKSNRQLEERRRLAAASAALRRQEEERVRRLEARRIEQLNKLMEERATVERLATFLGGLQKDLKGEPPLRVGRMLDWAQSRLARAELALTADALEQRLLAMGIFEEPELPRIADQDSGGVPVK